MKKRHEELEKKEEGRGGDTHCGGAKGPIHVVGGADD